MPTLRTVTLSTGFDDYYTVEGIAWGGVTRMAQFRSVPSGKGVSCARAALGLGIPVHAYAVVGAGDADTYRRSVEAEGLPLTLVPVPGQARHNLTLIDGTGQHTGAHFMADRPCLAGDDIAPMVEALLSEVAAGDVVTLNGAVPPGLPAETWAGLVPGLLERGARVIVDTQGEALTRCLEGPRITAYKPNDEEILSLPGIRDAADPVRAALNVLATGADLPLVSLGAHGVAVRDDGEPLRLTCPVEQPVASVMAGDTFVAGMAWALLDGESAPRAVASRGIAAAAAHVAGITGADLRGAAEANLQRVRPEVLR